MVRDDFPYFKHNPGWIYFDNAATSLKPQSVIDAINDYYTRLCANIGRGEYPQAYESEVLYEKARQDIASFIGSHSIRNIVFTAGTSASLNLVAYGLRSYLKAGDVILLEESGHASNLLPWFELAKWLALRIEYIPLDKKGLVNSENLASVLHSGVKVVALSHASNVLGNLAPIKDLAAIVHRYQALIVVDGAQACGHVKLDVHSLDVDFYAFSGHKLLGPTGVGVLYGKKECLELLETVYVGGGNNQSFTKTGLIEYKEIPYRFEAGTPNIAGVIGLGAAIQYLQKTGIDWIAKRIKELNDYAIKQLLELEHVELINKEGETGIISFTVKGIFAHDVAVYLNHYQVCVRAGEHCARLLGEAMDYPKTVRISLYFYNTEEEIDRFVALLQDISLEKCVALVI